MTNAAPSKVETNVRRRALITISVMLASIMQAIDTTIANIALPRIQGSLSATQVQMAWVLTSYIVAAAIMTPLSGWLAGRFGRKRVFLISIVSFTLASILCGLAQSLPEITIARVLQGLSGAAFIPLSQAVLLDINPPAKHGRAMAVWVLGVTVAPIMAPVLGGWLTENYNWRWVFFINVPVGILAFLGMVAFLPRDAVEKPRFDFWGFSSLSIAIGGFQLFLDRGQLNDWFSSTETCIEAIVAAVALYLFVVHTLTTTKSRFVDPGLFKDRNFVTGSVLFFVVGAVLFGTMALLPTLLQDLLEFPIVTSGMLLAPRGVGSFIAIMAVGAVIGKVDKRLMMAVGFALAAFSMWLMTGFNIQMDGATIAWPAFVQGLGTGFIITPCAVVTFVTLSPALRNEGTAIFSLVRNMGSSIGISMVETLLTRNTQIIHATLVQHVNPYRSILGMHLGVSTQSVAQLVRLNASVNQQAAMIAYNNDFELMMVLCLGSIPLLLLLRDGNASTAEVVAAE